MNIGAALIAFIQAELVGEERGFEVDVSTRLIDGDLIDSTGLIQIIGFIEEQTGVRIPDEEVMPENFQTVGSMERLIARLLSRHAGEGP